MSDSIYTAAEVVHATMDVLYNTSHLALVARVHGQDIHPNYAQEKLDQLARSVAGWYGRLDEERRAAFVAMVEERLRPRKVQRNAAEEPYEVMEALVRLGIIEERDGMVRLANVRLGSLMAMMLIAFGAKIIPEALADFPAPEQKP